MWRSQPAQPQGASESVKEVLPVSRFLDDVNRLFDEVLRTPWSPQRPRLRHPGPAGPGSVWEVEIPLGHIEPEDVSVTLQGTRISVTLGGRSLSTASATSDYVSTDRYEERRQSYALPSGAHVDGFEVQFEEQRVRVRVRLRAAER